MGPILGALGSLGHFFGRSGDVLESIFEALGVPCAPFLELWAPNGWLWGSSEGPLAAQGAQSEIFPICSLPFGVYFWSILEVKNPQKSDAFFDGFVSGVFVVLGWILESVLMIFWSFLGTFCDMAKTRKIARRVGESTKIEGWGDHKWRPNQKKSHRKQIPKLKREIIPKITKNGGQMEPKWSQKGIQKSMIFWLGFRTPLETSTELRRNFDGTSTGLQGSHFLQPTPQGGAILSKNIVQ